MADTTPVIPSVATEPGLHTQAQEWADKTTTDSINSTTRQVLSSASVSGDPNVPGAFHADANDQQASGFDSIRERVSDAANSVGETAKQYLPQAAQYLPKSVVDTVQGYLLSQRQALLPSQKLPTSSTSVVTALTSSVLISATPAAQSAQDTTQASSHDILHKVSLPSTEITGPSDHEHVGGVGSLPGYATETGVARLPDETPTPYSEPSTQTTSTTLGGNAQNLKDQTLSSSSTPQTSLLYAETSGAKTMSHSDGIGALPGSNTEPGVARLPGEISTHSNALSAGDSHAPTYVGLSGDAGLAGGMDNRDPTSGVHTGGELGTHTATEARPSAISPESEYSQPSFQASPPKSQSSVGKATGLAAVGSSGAAAGGMLAGGGFGGRDEDPQQPAQAIIGEQRNVTGSRGSHPEAGEMLSSVDTKAKGQEGEKLGRETAGGVTEKETQMTSGGTGAVATREGGKESPKETGGNNGAESKGSDLSSGDRRHPQTHPSSSAPDSHMSMHSHALNSSTAHSASLSPSEKAAGREILEMRVMDPGEREMRLKEDVALMERMGMGDAGVEHPEADNPQHHSPEFVSALRAVSTKSRAHALGREGATWRGVEVGGAGYRSMGMREEEEDDGTGYDTGYHPAELHPAGSQPSSSQNPTSGRAGESKREGVSHSGSSSSAGASGTPGKEGKKKVGFMEKMKGEAKVLLGHLEGGKKGEEKVEEGKRIKSGLPAKKDAATHVQEGKSA